MKTTEAPNTADRLAESMPATRDRSVKAISNLIDMTAARLEQEPFEWVNIDELANARCAGGHRFPDWIDRERMFPVDWHDEQLMLLRDLADILALIRARNIPERMHALNATYWEHVEMWKEVLDGDFFSQASRIEETYSVTSAIADATHGWTGADVDS